MDRQGGHQVGDLVAHDGRSSRATARTGAGSTARRPAASSAGGRAGPRPAAASSRWPSATRRMTSSSRYRGGWAARSTSTSDASTSSARAPAGLRRAGRGQVGDRVEGEAAAAHAEAVEQGPGRRAEEPVGPARPPRPRLARPRRRRVRSRRGRRRAGRPGAPARRRPPVVRPARAPAAGRRAGRRSARSSWWSAGSGSNPGRWSAARSPNRLGLVVGRRAGRGARPARPATPSRTRDVASTRTSGLARQRHVDAGRPPRRARARSCRGPA